VPERPHNFHMASSRLPGGVTPPAGFRKIPSRTPGFEDRPLVSRRGKPLKKVARDDGGRGLREDIDGIKAK